MKPSLKKLNTQDIVIQTLQSNLDTVFNYILSCPILDGKKLTIAFVANRDQVIAHGLGREYQGVLQSLTNNFFQLKVSDTPNYNKEQYIILQSTGSGVVDLWIY